MIVPPIPIETLTRRAPCAGRAHFTTNEEAAAAARKHEWPTLCGRCYRFHVGKADQATVIAARNQQAKLASASARLAGYMRSIGR